jgi:hypothetical protein
VSSDRAYNGRLAWDLQNDIAEARMATTTDLPTKMRAAAIDRFGALDNRRVGAHEHDTKR